MGYRDKEMDFLTSADADSTLCLLESIGDLHSCRERAVLPIPEGGLFLQEDSAESSQLPSEGAVAGIRAAGL